MAVILTMFVVAMMVGSVCAADSIKIGILAALSHDVGEGQVNGAKMATDVINAKGGINGKKLEIVIGDTELKPEKAINALKKMVMVDKVDAVVGGFPSGVALSLMDYFARFKVPFIDTGSASDQLTAMVAKDYDKYKYFFQLMVNETATAEGMVDLVVNFLHPKYRIQKIAVMAEDAKWTTLMAPMFIDGVKAKGIDVVDYIRFPLKEIDFAPTISRVKKANVDFLFEISAIADGTAYINQWHDMQGPPIGGCNTSAGADDFWEKTNGKCLSEIVFMYGSYPVDVTPTTRNFWNDYSARFGIVPRYSSGFTYDAVMVLAESFKKAGNTKADAVVKALENVSYLGCSGLIEFNKKNHNVIYGDGRPTLVWLQWQGKANRVPFYPEKYAEGNLIFPKWHRKNN
jgi:branched-chain amino acid transport system substrate-binding protein